MSLPVVGKPHLGRDPRDGCVLEMGALKYLCAQSEPATVLRSGLQSYFIYL